MRYVIVDEEGRTLAGVLPSGSITTISRRAVSWATSQDRTLYIVPADRKGWQVTVNPGDHPEVIMDDVQSRLEDM